MGQTARTQTDLYAHLPDQQTQDISPEDVRDIVASWGYDNSGTPPKQAISAADRKLYATGGTTVAAKWDNADGDLKNGDGNYFIATYGSGGFGTYTTLPAGTNPAGLLYATDVNAANTSANLTWIPNTNTLSTTNLNVTGLTANTFIFAGAGGALTSVADSRVTWNPISYTLTINNSSLAITTGNLTVTGGTISGQTVFTNTAGTPFSPGSVIFVGSSGYATENHDNFHWNNSGGSYGLSIATGNHPNPSTNALTIGYIASSTVPAGATNLFTVAQNGDITFMGDMTGIVRGTYSADKDKTTFSWNGQYLGIGNFAAGNSPVSPGKQLDIFWDCKDPGDWPDNDLNAPYYDGSNGCLNSASVRITGNRDDLLPVAIEVKNLNDCDPAETRPDDDIADWGTAHEAFVRAGIYLSVGRSTHGGQIFATKDYNVNYGIANGLNIRPNLGGQDVSICAGYPVDGAASEPTLLVHHNQFVGVRTNTPSQVFSIGDYATAYGAPESYLTNKLTVDLDGNLLTISSITIGDKSFAGNKTGSRIGIGYSYVYGGGKLLDIYQPRDNSINDEGDPRWPLSDDNPPAYDDACGCSSSASVRITGNREDKKPVFLEIKNLNKTDPLSTRDSHDKTIDLHTTQEAFVRAGIYMSVGIDTDGGQLFATMDTNTPYGIVNGLNIRPNKGAQDVSICAGTLVESGGGTEPTLMIYHNGGDSLLNGNVAVRGLAPPQRFTVNPTYSFTVNLNGDTTTPHLLDDFGVILGTPAGNASISPNRLRTLTANDGNTAIGGKTALDWHVPNAAIMRNTSLATNNILPVTESHYSTENSYIASIWNLSDSLNDSKASNHFTMKNGVNASCSHWSTNTRINPDENPTSSTGSQMKCAGASLDFVPVNPDDKKTWLYATLPDADMIAAGNTNSASYTHWCWSVMGWAYIPTNNASCPIFYLGGVPTYTPPWAYSSKIYVDVVNGNPRYNMESYTSTSSTTLTAGWHHFCLCYGFEKWIAGSPNYAYYNAALYVDGVIVSDPTKVNSQGLPALHTALAGDWGTGAGAATHIIVGNGPMVNGPVDNMLFEEWAIYIDKTTGPPSHNGYDLGVYPISNDYIASFAANPTVQHSQSKQVYDPSNSRIILGPYSATNPNGGTLSFKHPYPIPGFGLISTITFANAGSGYAVGNLLSVVDGTGVGGFVKVASISGGGGTGPVTSVTIDHAGINYLAGATYSTTGGAETGCQIILPSTTATTINWDTGGNIQTITLTSNTTFAFINPSDPRNSTTTAANLQIIIKQDGTGSRLVTWPTITWAGGSAPTLSTTAGAVDIIDLLYDGTTYYGSGKLSSSNLLYEDLTLTSTHKVIFNAATEYINSANTGYLDLHSASDLRITTGANKTLALQVPVYNDLPPFPLSMARTTGSTKPDLVAFNGTTLYQQEFALNAEVHGNTEITHEYKEGTDIEVHIHWAPGGTNNNARGVKWQFDYQIANINGTFTAGSTLSVDVTLDANVTAFTHHVSAMTAKIPGSGVTIGTHILWRIKRVATTHVNGAPSTAPFGIALGMHVEIDTMGSRNWYSK